MLLFLSQAKVARSIAASRCLSGDSDLSARGIELRWRVAVCLSVQVSTRGGDMKVHRGEISAFALFVAAALSSPGAGAATVSCESLASLHLPDTTISVAATVPAGTVLPPPIGAIVTTMCRVAGSIKPTSDPDLKFQGWMPVAGC